MCPENTFTVYIFCCSLDQLFIDRKLQAFVEQQFGILFLSGRAYHDSLAKIFDFFCLEQPAHKKATNDGADSAERSLLLCCQNLQTPEGGCYLRNKGSSEKAQLQNTRPKNQTEWHQTHTGLYPPGSTLLLICWRLEWNPTDKQEAGQRERLH